MDEPKWIGYSNGVAYPLYNVKSGNLGLCEVEGCVFLEWCLFEKIEKIGRVKKKVKTVSLPHEKENRIPPHEA